MTSQPGGGAWRRTLVARFAWVTGAVMLAFTLGNLLIIGSVFQGELSRTLTQNLASASTRFEATLEREGAVLHAGGAALANQPLLKAAMASAVVDAETLAAVAQEQREALRVDLLVLLDAAGKARAASPHLGAVAVAPSTKGAQLIAVDQTLFLASVSPITAGDRVLGSAVVGRRLNEQLLAPLRESLELEVLIRSPRGVALASVSKDAAAQLLTLRLAPGEVKRVTAGSTTWMARELALGADVSALLLLKTEATTSRFRLMMLALTGLGIVLAAVIGSAGVLGVRRLLAPLQALTLAAARVVEQHDLQQLDVGGEGEVGELAGAFRDMISKLRDALGQLQRAGKQIGGAVEQMLESSGRQERGAHQQSDVLNRTSSTTVELAKSAALVATNAATVAKIAARTLDAANAGRVNADALSESVKQAMSDQKAIAGATSALGQRIAKVSQMAAFISDVSDRTDLLALNAGLEGTRAGAAGKGFVLVAGEMRRLAESVSQSTREIAQQISAIQEATGAVLSASAAASTANRRWVDLAGSTSQQLDAIVAHARETAEAAAAISSTTQEQQQGALQLAETMAELLTLTNESLETTREVGAANQELSVLAKDLSHTVGRFKVD